ncbi:peptidylprolyl isomerase [Melissococcus plutonius]|uniref:Peptidyl-prolyl cis-trans isomerase n=2 Tax=Melissococcus plutonius TaxID=33970 RepID=A0A2Z5Y2N7_9ENTE|nr:peptidylprolyl isomerase [Melissococcus plutonius]BAL62133.1 peptidyl-prolyl cis-trans isomerase [Melissococcus plutonius DAT561]MCV2497901.1 peptidylprolyl isomerase [Melissococcus plutonius]MCV2500492.1 peptidylprolyl isomerase [Melissococcus plutonius]MCV2505240.1 peptidylprolyl isomerase [Melissococcus plutonius]MCV2506516.1 peptidylprolyl isomerase [Melissococcus plutonius]
MTMKWKNILLVTFLMATSLAIVTGCHSTASSSSNHSTPASQNKEKKKKTVNLNTLTLPQLNTTVTSSEDLLEIQTGEGNIQVKLFPKIAPKAVENFVQHAKNNYYNHTKFHRVIKNFMIQGGDPKGDGTGGESIWKKPFKNEISNQLYHIRGALSMANAGQNTNGSQFFIVQNTEDKSDGLLKEDYPEKIIQAYKKGGSPDLDGDYTIFGQVIKGMDVVDKIASGETEASTSGNEKSKPKSPVTVEKITVLQTAK